MGWIKYSMGLLLAAVCLGIAPAWAAEPEEAVRAHFLDISAENYNGADQFFSAAFRRAFKGDLAALDRYYIMRRAQLAAGFDVLATERLADRDRETARVTVEFRDPDPNSIVMVAERLHYYLVREKADAGSPQRDRDGQAWRIDIFDALAFDTLAEARRRPYLYTREAWPEDEGRELKAQQGLYRVQQALESFKRVTGQYPLRLLGADNRRDELISGKYLPERYPLCGFDDRPMQSVEFGIRSSGDFTYYSYDRDGDGKPDGYWLLLHGKVPAHALFAGRDTILVLADGYRAEQGPLSWEFAQWWQAQRGESVQPGPALGADWAGSAPQAAPLEAPPAADAPEAAAIDAPPVALGVLAAPGELVAPGTPEAAPLPEALPAGVGDALSASSDAVARDGAAAVPETLAAAHAPLPTPAEELHVHSWGFR